MKLEPAEYTCPDHHTDLTGQVLDALDEEDGPPVAYRGGPCWAGRPGRGRSRCMVTCPGGASGGPHPLTCAGTWTR